MHKTRVQLAVIATLGLAVGMASPAVASQGSECGIGEVMATSHAGYVDSLGAPGLGWDPGSFGGLANSQECEISWLRGQWDPEGSPYHTEQYEPVIVEVDAGEPRWVGGTWVAVGERPDPGVASDPIFLVYTITNVSTGESWNPTVTQSNWRRIPQNDLLGANDWFLEEGFVLTLAPGTYYVDFLFWEDLNGNGEYEKSYCEEWWEEGGVFPYLVCEYALMSRTTVVVS